MQEGTLRNQDDGRSVLGDPSLAPEVVQTQLERILASPLFCKAPRHSRFLSFVVRKSLAGESESVKEYLIGLEVFDRDPGYDPGTDPIVRAEARRLRSRLADYYREVGQHDPVQIGLPKGTYVPTFHSNGVTAKLAIGEGASRSKIEEHGEKVSIVPAIEPIPPAIAKRKRHLALIAVLAILILALAGYSIHKLYARKTLVSPVTEGAPNNVLVLAEFTNTTGDAVFDHALRQGLSSQLEQSPFLNLLSDQRIAQTLSLMAQPKDTRLTHEIARDVCQRTASAATIEGSISSLGTQYVVGLKAVNCHNGDQLAQEQTTAAGKEQVLKALGDTATKIREKLGESLSSLQKFDAPPESVTTASLEALQAYSIGLQDMIVKGDYIAAIPFFLRATQLDPNFAMAYARLGTNYNNLGELERSSDAVHKAYDLRERASERERFYIASHYEDMVERNSEAARTTYE